MSVYLIDGYNLLHQILGQRESGASGGARRRGGRQHGSRARTDRDRVGGGPATGPGDWDDTRSSADAGHGDIARQGSIDLEDERRRLLDRIASYMGGTSDRAVVVFDSHSQLLQKSESATAQVEVYFGSFSHSADAIIEREVYAVSAGENVVVVSSDHQLQQTVFLPNVIRCSSRQFAGELQAHTRRIANRQNCITMSHRIEERIPAGTLEKLARLRDELEHVSPPEEPQRSK